ncbi:ATP-binding cassette domain-containing protein [Pseudonocardia sp. NPDC049635]|uniref:ATP-binding cassette domain-containing protein n=1 Tax=Pseudonocardia sp. NPDC049635 TaxID=3155506 RepID=UPI0033FB6B93
MSGIGPVLWVRQARIGWPGQVVAAGLAFEAWPEETVVLAGPSGAGKTTVLRAVTGLLPLLGGEVRRGSGRLGVAFQEPRLLPWCSVFENVLFPLGRRPGARHRDRARELLERLGLGDRLDARPGELSGGMCRRVSLARALAVEPELLVVDEPFAHLDEGWADRVEELLAGAASGGAAVLVAAHQPERIARLATFTVALGCLPVHGGTAR